MSSRRAPIHGIFGRPFVDLEHLLGADVLDSIDAEVCAGLAHVETSYTGGTLKWMGVVAPWQRDDDYLDAMEVIEKLPPAEFRRFLSLGDAGSNVPGSTEDLAHGDSRLTFGDETDRPFTTAQMRWLAYRHGAYFPWKVCYHLLENDRWEDKHSGAGKAFSLEAEEVFPETLRAIRQLPFREVGRAVIFGLEPNDHAPLHRDTEPGRSLSVAQCISISPRGDKRLCLQNAEDDDPVIVDKRVYWFNDMDYHGVLADPWFRYSIRIDGVFQPSFLRDLERHTRRSLAR